MSDKPRKNKRRKLTRKRRSARTILVLWLSQYYLLQPDEQDLAIIWVSVRGDSMAELPYGRKIAVLDLNKRKRDAEKSKLIA